MEKYSIQIDRFYPSSKKCNICRYQKNDLTLDIREWTCQSATHNHRNINATKNILNEGIRIQKENTCTA